VTYRRTIAAGLLGVMLGAASPSYAQGPRLPNGFIAPEGIIAIVRANGMNPIGPPIMAGPTYLVPAVGPRGVPSRVVVDARTGRIRNIAR